MQSPKQWLVITELFFVFVFASGLLRAQQQPLANADTVAPATLQDEAEAPTPTLTAMPPTAIDTQIHPAGKAVPWLGTSSPLHWGPLSIGGIDYFYVRDRFNPNGGFDPASNRLQIMHIDLDFDRAFGKNHIALQYIPQLAILDGQVRGQVGGNNVLALGTTFQLSPRVDLILKDDFAQVQSRQLFSDAFLDADRNTGGVLQNNFLATTGSFIENTVGALVNYHLSARSAITFTGDYRYARATDTTINYIANGHDIIGSVAYSYALSPHRSIGVVQSTELLRTVRPIVANNYFTTTGVFYAQQLSPTLWIKGNLGVQGTLNPGFPITWTLATDVSIVKNYQRAVLAVAYGRGRTTNLYYITPRSGNRVDASIGYHFTTRWIWNNGFGYYNELGADPRTNGKYGSSSIEYHLPFGLVMFANYTYTVQNSSTPQLLSGIRNTYFSGIRWEAPVKVAH